MIKQIGLLIILLALGFVSYWLLFPKYAPPPVVPALVVHRGPTGLPDSVLVSAGPQYRRSAFGAFFLGQHNRSLWTLPVKAKVFYLNQAFGGLKILAVGGGMQTLSFTLQDSAGRSYALRSVDKDPISVLPLFWQKTGVGHFVRDQISGANPYGALVVPVLAQAAGIFHSYPQLRYIRPQDSLLGPYAAHAGGKLFLLEEEHKGNPALYPGLETATALVDTDTLLQNLLRSKKHRLEAEAYVKCRLFDFLIGDWDRHKGQWMWAAYSRAAETWYVPIPKDRDQAFSNYRDGLLPWLITRKWAMPKFGQFSETLDDVPSLAINAAHLDTLLLAHVPAKTFLKAARDLQQSLTDTVINRSVQELPASVRQVCGTTIREKLQARRKQLPEAAWHFYQLMAHPTPKS